MLRIGLPHGNGLIVATAALLLSFALPAESAPILADNIGTAWMEAVKPNDLLFTPIGHTGGPVQSAAAQGRYVLAGAGQQLLVFDTLISARLRLVFESQALSEQIEGITIARCEGESSLYQRTLRWAEPRGHLRPDRSNGDQHYHWKLVGQ